MTRHQSHGADVAPLSQSLIAHMPAISEDGHMAGLDGPPDTDSFTKYRPQLLPRRESMLTRALHSDSEYPHEDDHQNLDFAPLPSRSSTCSTTYSGVSVAGFTSDEGHNSTGTRASTPCSPPHSPLGKRSMFSFFKPSYQPTPIITTTTTTTTTTQQSVSPTHKLPTPVSASDSSEPKVEAELGRKRCISFACGRKPASPKPAPFKDGSARVTVEAEQVKVAPAKRPCMIKFACPSKVSGKGLENPPRKPSPAPQGLRSSSSSVALRSARQHRGSDTTIQADSPKSIRKSPIAEHKRKASSGSDVVARETRKFYEFASSDPEEEEDEEWTRKSIFPSRLTISDTLRKENVIRKTCEEAEEEALAEDEAVDEDDEDEDDFGFSDEDCPSEGGFQTDDEDGFADSDGEDSGSDYEWWTPRKTRSSSPYVSLGAMHPQNRHETDSESSVHSRLRVPRRKSPTIKVRKASSSVAIRPKSPEADLPDSTDFVCGTLDEDRPLEEAFKQHIEARRAAKHKPIPQDTDPTFPTSDPDMGSSDESDGNGNDAPTMSVAKPKANAEHRVYLPYDMSEDENEHRRGRKPTASHPKRSPQASPRRLRSPVLAKRNKSPAPHTLFNHSPKRPLSPAPTKRLTSPPPSPLASATSSPAQAPATITMVAPSGGTIFLGHRPQLTHTSSLPRSPRPFYRGSKKTSAPVTLTVDASDEDEGELTAGPHEKKSRKYHRGAIDIVQGLEAKRLRRRQKFYEKYCRKEKRREERREDRAARRPLPGKGAERMRQVGIECANYRGARVISV